LDITTRERAEKQCFCRKGKQTQKKKKKKNKERDGAMDRGGRSVFKEGGGDQEKIHFCLVRNQQEGTTFLKRGRFVINRGGVMEKNTERMGAAFQGKKKKQNMGPEVKRTGKKSSGGNEGLGPDG